VINFKSKAVLLREGKTSRLDILTAADAFSQENPGNIPIEDYSHRKRLEKIKALRETDRRLVEKFRAEGLSEGEAMLRAGDELEKMGLYPKSPRITAKSIERPKGDHAAFPISRDEFRYGLFPDIEKAINETGAEVRFWGNYISHTDYDTSRRINEHLSKGNAQFYVITGGKTYLMTITR